ncbi:MAG TPA: hypothetical protein VLJ76_07785 [Gaiellaceae bacterium]|nr:hypothetical protein [Gaiellaceae bacterium]
MRNAVPSDALRAPPAEAPQQKRHLHLVEPIAKELRHLHEVESEGDSPTTALIVFTQVLVTVLVAVAVELTLAYAFYFGWL